MQELQKDKLLMFIPTNIHSGVFESQMLGLAKYYSRKFEIVLAIHESIKIKNLDYKIIRYNNRINIIKYLKSFKYIYIRGSIDFIVLFPFSVFRKIKTIYDFRALICFESYSRNNNPFKFIILYSFELIAYLFSNRIQVVSQALANKLKNIFFFRRKLKIIPCLVFESNKRSDPCSDTIKFIYVGGVSSWQKIEKILSIMTYLNSSINCFFTFITPQQKELKQMIDKSKLINYELLSGNNKYVQEKLLDQDFGFLIRDDLTLNNISSPIKFLEYTSNGVVPIVTPFIGDYSKDVEDHEIGIIYRENNEELIRKIMSTSNDIVSFRSRLFKYSRSMTWDKYHY